MARFNPASYDPKTDSTPGYEATPGLVIALPTETACHCGCQEERGPKTLFRMGHDARLKGKLTRAHLAGVPVSNFGTRIALEVPAVTYAEQYNSAKFSWSEALEAAATKAASKAQPAAADEPVDAETAGLPKVGSLLTVKVGRWEYEGRVVSFTSEADGSRGLQVEYTTKSGETKTVVVPAV